LQGKEITVFSKNKLNISSYYDSTTELGKTYYYQLTAFDDAGNFAEGRTEEIEYETGLRKKITTFFARPNYQLRTITLTWKCNEKKVLKYILYRCKKGEPMEIYKSFEDKELTNTWAEKGLSIGYVYQYQIKAILSNGVKTEISDIVEVRF
jgi:uncharacterized protein